MEVCWIPVGVKLPSVEIVDTRSVTELANFPEGVAKLYTQGVGRFFEGSINRALPMIIVWHNGCILMVV